MKLHHKIANIGAVLSLTAMISAVTIQVFARFFLESAPPWTEEAARIFFIYLVAFGVGIGIRNGDFIQLDLIDKYLSQRYSRILQIISHMTVIAFSGVLIVYSWQFIKLGLHEKSPALQLSMALVFLSMLIVGLSIAIFMVEQFRDLVNNHPRR